MTTTWWRRDRDPAAVFIDYNQNARDHTMASAYSVRGNPRATVSAPVTWSEIDDIEPDDFTIATMPARFADLGDLHAEIDDVAKGTWPVEDNPLRGAPHTAECLVAQWDHPYSRETAVYPSGLPSAGARAKVWPGVRRIDGAFGDRNLVCNCPPIEAFSE